MEVLCLLCGKLVCKMEMKKHMERVHENDKEVKCKNVDCDLVFVSEKKMLNHQRIHSAKVFTCDEVNCQYLSKNKSNLARHKNNTK